MIGSINSRRIGVDTVKKVQNWLIALVLSSLSACSTTKPLSRSGNPIEASLESSHIVKITLNNAGRTTIKMSESELPWVGRYSCWFKAFEDDLQGSPLEEAFPPSDRAITEPVIILKPGETMTGRVDIEDRFPTLVEVLKSENVVLFWRYSSANSALSDSGMLVIERQPKGDKSARDK